MDNKVIVSLVGIIPENCYERIDILVNNTPLTARPIEYAHAEDGLPMKALKYETVNPDNGQLLQFDISEIVSQFVQAPPIIQVAPKSSCGKKTLRNAQTSKVIKSELPVENELVELLSNNKNPFAIKGGNLGVDVGVDINIPFIDPIEVGLFKIDSV